MNTRGLSTGLIAVAVFVFSCLAIEGVLWVVILVLQVAIIGPTTGLADQALGLLTSMIGLCAGREVRPALGRVRDDPTSSRERECSRAVCSRGRGADGLLGRHTRLPADAPA